MKSSMRGTAGAVALIIAVGLFYLLTIRAGHRWSDFALYVHHAKNLVEGVPYRDTGHIYNYHDPGDTPRAYPPVFPLLLTPVYKFFGLNFTAMKMEVVLLWMAALAMLFFLWRCELSAHASIALVAMVGLNPFYWDFKDEVLSDFPFMLTLAVALYLIHRWHGTSSSPKQRAVRALVLGLALFLAYGTRPAGALLAMALPLLDLLQRRRLRLDTVATLAVFGSLLLLNRWVFGSDPTSNYAASLSMTFQDTWLNLSWWLPWELNLLLQNGYSWRLVKLLVLLLSMLAAFGYLLRVRRRVTILEVFTGLYLVLIIVNSYSATQDTRYLIPLFPWYLFYVVVGLEEIRTRIPAAISRVALAGLTAIVLASYTGRYTKIDFGPIRNGVTDPEAVELFAYIREKTNPKDVFIFSRAIHLSLFGERASSAYWVPERTEELWTYAGEIGATHFAVGTGRRKPMWSPDFIWSAEDGVFYRQFASANLDRLVPVFSNADFVLYRITSYPPTQQAALKPSG